MVENTLRILVSRFRVLLGTRDIVFYMCVVAQHAEDTPGQGRQGTNPSKCSCSPMKWTGGVGTRW